MSKRNKNIFIWDKGNKDKNVSLHNVTNKESEELFEDDNKVLFSDIKHSSEEEERYVVIGKTKTGRLLYQVFTIRDGKVRVISSRDANRREVPYYEKKINTT